MPITYRTSRTVIPGVRLNVNKKSYSWTFGFPVGPHFTWSSTGRRTLSFDLPGGFGWRKVWQRRNRDR